MRAVRAPLPSRRALVTTVVAWARKATSPAAIPWFPSAVATASSTPRPKSRGVVETFTTAIRPVAASARTTSVNVPPMSTPRRQLIAGRRLRTARSSRGGGFAARPREGGQSFREHLKGAGGVLRGVGQRHVDLLPTLEHTAPEALGV